MAVSIMGLTRGGITFLKSIGGSLWADVAKLVNLRPIGIIGRRLQLDLDCAGVDCLLTYAPCIFVSGSLNNTAVAGKVLETRNPELPSRTVLKTEITTAPCKPVVKRDTSASTAAF